jgi:hypothetical protein
MSTADLAIAARIGGGSEGTVGGRLRGGDDASSAFVAASAPWTSLPLGVASVRVMVILLALQLEP